MNLFLYIQITDLPEEVKFSNPIISYLKEQKIDTTIYDLDNHSDSLIISYVNKLLTESENILIFIDSNHNSKFSTLLPLLTNVLDNPEGVKIIFKGNNTRLRKMISILPHSEIPENTYGLEQIVQFFDKIF